MSFRRHGAVVFLCAIVPLASAGCCRSLRGPITACVETKLLADRRIPGAVIATSRGSAFTGLADVGTNRRVARRDRFRIGSITKTYTATLVLQLADEGKLSLDDTLTSLLGAQRVAAIPHAERITVRQLLSMRSGIAEYNTPEFRTRVYADPNRAYTPDELIAEVNGKSPFFAPDAACGECTGYCLDDGVCWKYSNTSYILLGMIIEKVTGNSYAQELQRRIVRPLRLRNTFLATSTKFDAPRVNGYMFKASAQIDCPSASDTLTDVTNCISPTVAWSAGAIVSSVADMRKWIDVMIRGTLLEPETQKERFTFVEGDHGGARIGYGYGVMRLGIPFSNPQRVFIGHAGEFFGYAAVAFASADCRTDVIGMVNATPANDANVVVIETADSLLCAKADCPN